MNIDTTTFPRVEKGTQIIEENIAVIAKWVDDVFQWLEGNRKK